MKHQLFLKKGLFLLFILIILVGCNTNKSDKGSAVEDIVTSITKKYVPDKRIAIFEIQSQTTPNGHIIKGATNLPEALESLRATLDAQQISYIDSIEILPSASLGKEVHGLIKVSVANLRGRPAHSAEMVTQGTLGTPVKVLQKEGSWYRVQTPDQYLGWVDGGGVAPMDKASFKAWQGADKLIYTKTFGNSHTEANTDSQVVSDLVFGNILQLISEKNDFFEVKYPNGKKAFVAKSDATPYDQWKSTLSFAKESLVSTSKKMLGVPYLWGGTSAKGVDCSGFTKTVALVTPSPGYSPYSPYGGPHSAGPQFNELEAFLGAELNVTREDLSDGSVSGGTPASSANGSVAKFALGSLTPCFSAGNSASRSSSLQRRPP